MSNSSSRAFYTIPQQTGNVGETITIPTVEEFLKTETPEEETHDVISEPIHDQYLNILKEEEKIIERKIEILTELQSLSS